MEVVIAPKAQSALISALSVALLPALFEVDAEGHEVEIQEVSIASPIGTVADYSRGYEDAPF